MCRRVLRLSPSCHYYDNDLAEGSAAPVYSCVQRRAKPLAAALSATPIYDIAVPAKDCQRSGNKKRSTEDLEERWWNKWKDRQVEFVIFFFLFSFPLDEQPSSTNDDYEEFSTVNDPSITCSAGGIGQFFTLHHIALPLDSLPLFLYTPSSVLTCHLSSVSCLPFIPSVLILTFFFCHLCFGLFI